MPGAPPTIIEDQGSSQQQVMPAQLRGDAQDDVTAREEQVGQGAEPHPLRLAASYGTMPDGVGAVSVNGGGASTEAPATAQAPAGPQQDSNMTSTIAERRDRALVGTELQEGAMAAGSTGFVTPRSHRTPETSQNNWMGMEWPRWVTRLGTMLNIPAIPSPGDFVPSPMLSDGPRPVPPGGHSFVLSPPRRRPSVRAPSPPSSSSIPQEAIQAEVQRQLGGLLERLQRAEGDNEVLREQLRVAQAGENSQPRALLGDLLDAPSGPGPLSQSLPGAAVPPRGGELLDLHAGQGVFAEDPSGRRPSRVQEWQERLPPGDPPGVFGSREQVFGPNVPWDDPLQHGDLSGLPGAPSRGQGARIPEGV